MTLPRDPVPDATLAFLRDGYRFIGKRAQRFRSDVFETRLLLQRATCMLGREAAEVFYTPGRLTRKRAMPPTTLMALQDVGSVQQLDGEDHRHRKGLFLSILSPEEVTALVAAFADVWRERLPHWQRLERVVLLDEVAEVLCRAVCRWAGIALSEASARRRTHEVMAMLHGAGAVGPRNWRGLWLRRKTERWARFVIERARREGEPPAAERNALQAIAWHRDLRGNLLPAEIAAVELINVVRPTVAVTWFVTFAALALHQYPAARARVAAGDGDYVDWFVDEVRRFYPFFAGVGGRVLEAFEWRGQRFERGRWLILDLYGTNHDPRAWEDPEAFRPERFGERRTHHGALVPQGAGAYTDDHRCPGEPATAALMRRAVQLLVNETVYRVPPQDLSIDLRRMPAFPKSGFEIELRPER